MVRDKLKKFNIKVILLVLFGFGLIFIGVGSLNIKLGVSKVNLRLIRLRSLLVETHL